MLDQPPPAILTSIIKAGLGLLCRTHQARLSGQLRMQGLKKPVEILRDKWGVPHIYAVDFHDLLFAQGYVHAQDRLWQMEFNRRLAAGRLSEILGPLTIPADRWLRTLTMRRVAEYEVKLINTEVRSFLQAYANGINAFIDHSRLPIEFTLLRYKPEPWIIADTLAWIKMMAWSLSVNWEMEILRAKLVDYLGPELATELETPQLKRWPYIVPPGTDYSYIGNTALEHAQAAQPFTGPSPYEGIGSNNWILSGEHTSSGMPILANDMHLQLGIPSIWYENHLVCEEINITGIQFPGIPGIISGHNGHVAWGHTNGFPDVQDLYMERLRNTEDGRVQAEYNGEWEDVRVLIENIVVKGEESIIEKVIITRHGPIINNLAPDFIGEQPLALRWTALEPDTMIQSLFNMLFTTSCQEFHQALQRWTTPVQNVVYADTAGNIAYTYPGKIPIRAKGDGRFPVPGWTDEYEWSGYIPFAKLPHMLNPEDGFIASANNYPYSDDYPLPFPVEAISGDRAQRIVELIQEKFKSPDSKIDIQYVQKMQFDLISPSARIVAAHIGRLSLSKTAFIQNPRCEEIFQLMGKWDGKLSAESAEAAIYQVFTRKMSALILSGAMEQPVSDTQASSVEDLVSRVMGKGPNPILTPTSLIGERSVPWLINLMSTPDSHWFNFGQGEGCDGVIRKALQATVEELQVSLGPEISDWAWGKLHHLTYRHTLEAGSGALALLFNRGPYPMGGDNTTVWATGTSYHDINSDRAIGPPFRMIVDLGNLSKSLGLNTPGQSGNPSSKYYDNQIEAWFNGEYHPMLYNRDDVEENTSHILQLIPQNS